MGEAEERALVVRIAHTWRGTKYRHMGRMKGVGCDCLTLLAEVFHEAGLVPQVSIPYYPPDFMHHSGAERYLNGLLKYTGEVELPPLPGDIALWKFGRCFSHAAIVIEWPMVIHAYVGRTVTQENAEAAAWLTHIGERTGDQGKPRPRRFLSYWRR